MSDSAARAGLSRTAPDRLTLMAFAAFVILGGSVAIGLRFIFGELAPYWSGVLRFGSAALIFWFLMLIRKIPVPQGRALLGAVLFGLLSVGVSFVFIYYGLTKTEASLASTTVAIVPLFTLLFASLHGLERFQLRGVIGGILSLLGISVAVSGSLLSGVDVSLPHILALVIGSACFAEAGVVVKLFPSNHPFATNAIAMTVGASILAAASLINGESWALPSSSSVWLALLYIITAATVGTFLLYLFVLNRWTASGTSYGFVLFPVATVILASVLTDETVSLLLIVGAVLVLAGVYVGALMPSRKEEPLDPEEAILTRPGMPNCV